MAFRGAAVPVPVSLCRSGRRKFLCRSPSSSQKPQATLRCRDFGERDPRGEFAGTGDRSRPQAGRQKAARRHTEPAANGQPATVGQGGTGTERSPCGGGHSPRRDRRIPRRDRRGIASPVGEREAWCRAAAGAPGRHSGKRGPGDSPRRPHAGRRGRERQARSRGRPHARWLRSEWGAGDGGRERAAQAAGRSPGPPDRRRGCATGSTGVQRRIGRGGCAVARTGVQRRSRRGGCAVARTGVQRRSNRRRTAGAHRHRPAGTGRLERGTDGARSSWVRHVARRGRRI
jgi:hypothetical protein